MEENQSYYECKRCFFTCYQKITMKKHLERLKTCDRILDSYKYNDIDLYELSMTRIKKKKNEPFCSKCNKYYKNMFSLKRHQYSIHKNDENEYQNEEENEENNNSNENSEDQTPNSDN